MRSLSLRGWLLIVSLLFAVLVAGGTALTTYLIVAEGMQTVAAESSEATALAAKAELEETIVAARHLASEDQLPRSEERRRARRLFFELLPRRLDRGDLAHSDFVLYDENLDEVWSSAGSDSPAGDGGARALARSTRGATRSRGVAGSPFGGLVSEADLGQFVVHVPFSIPGGGTGVLDVIYSPVNEERVIDGIRLPMTALAISALIVMVVLMQTSMAWVLGLVSDLRKAADSIDAGRLDERLPDQARNEIGELASSLNRLIERLQRRSEAQARFVADASHELATPVAGIRGYTNILRAWGGEDETVRGEAIDAIDRESRRMARLTTDLLNLLHADQGLRLRKERFDLNVLARELIASTASRYLNKDIEFEGPEEESLTMVGDKDRMEDVLSILLDNAAKYTPVGGSVVVDTSRRRERVTITVSDTGVGIPQEDVARVFDRFYRSDEARSEKEGGFGLGLAIAKGIVDSMNGTITVQSELGVGTRFSVVVPRGRL